MTYTYTQASHVVLVVKNLTTTEMDIRGKDLIPGLGRCPGRGHGNPLQYSCLVDPLEREARQAIVYRFAKSQTQLK